MSFFFSDYPYPSASQQHTSDSSAGSALDALKGELLLVQVSGVYTLVKGTFVDIDKKGKNILLQEYGEYIKIGIKDIKRVFLESRNNEITSRFHLEIAKNAKHAQKQALAKENERLEEYARLEELARLKMQQKLKKQEKLKELKKQQMMKEEQERMNNLTQFMNNMGLFNHNNNHHNNNDNDHSDYDDDDDDSDNNNNNNSYTYGNHSNMYNNMYNSSNDYKSQEQDMSNIKDTKTNLNNNYSVQIEKETLSNALVLMIPISDYGRPNQAGGDLPGVEIDCQKMIDLWQKQYGYKFYIGKNKNGSTKFKWNKSDVETYIDKARNEFNRGKYDSLICIISCHGQSKGTIVLSDGTPFELNTIFHHFDSVTNKTLNDKPKIFFLDCCRGGGSAFAAPVPIHTDNGNFRSRSVTGKQSKAYSPKDSQFVRLYGNTEGFMTTELTGKGGIFLSSVNAVFSQQKGDDLRTIILKLRKKTKMISGVDGAQMVEEHVAVKSKIYFKRRDSDGNNASSKPNAYGSYYGSQNINQFNFY